MKVSINFKKSFLLVSGFASSTEKNKALDAIEKLDLTVLYQNEKSLFVTSKKIAVVHVVKNQLEIELGIY